MERYTIYCTEEQTKKAIKLGAPIITAPIRDELYQPNCYYPEKDIYCTLPTAEEMIGWIEKQETIHYIGIIYDHKDKEWAYLLCPYKEEDFASKSSFSSRKEATLAAIDAALEYLTNKTMEK